MRSIEKQIKTTAVTFFTVAAMVFLMILGTVLQSCSDSDDPSATRVDLEMKATTSLSTLKSGRTKNSGLEFQEVLIGVTELEFETLEEDDAEENGEYDDEDGDGEDDNEEVEFEGRFVVDLINGTSTPDFGVSTVVPGVYEEIEIEMEPILEGGNTMFIAFEFTPEGADPVNVEYSNKYDLEFEIERDAGFTLDDGALNRILIIFDLDALFDGVDLNTASADTDGVVRINENSNADLADIIENNLDDVLEAGEDDDDDGDIDDD